ncbi:DnaC-like protein [Ralstonia phage UAM5]|nr:DnaC-like protein [Ralstonia phage UAM5]
MKHIGQVLPEGGKIEPKTFERAAACARHGAYTERGGSFTGREDRVMWFGCPDCAREAREREHADSKAREERERQERLERRLRLSGIPMGFRDRTFDSFVATQPEQEHAVAVAREFADNFWAKHAPAGTFLVFGGNPGTGKSHLAIAAAQQVMQRGTAMYLDAMDLIRRVRATWRKDAEQTEEDVLRMLGGTLDLLVIDEIGVQRGTEDEQMILFDVLNRRYRDLRPTILLTNLGGKALGEFLGPRIMDRLMERSIMVAFKWESHRGKL